MFLPRIWMVLIVGGVTGFAMEHTGTGTGLGVPGAVVVGIGGAALGIWLHAELPLTIAAGALGSAGAGFLAAVALLAFVGALKGRLT